ncbi:MAG: hypothetical protein Kow00105_12900 [Phycisphaeraceae bacterium]
MNSNPNPSDPPDATDTGSLRPGDQVGLYTIGSLLGTSTASVVWRARHTESAQDVVIRELIPGSPAAREKSFLDRCRREVDRQKELIGKVRRVVLLQELLDDPRGAFLVTDFVNGTSIDQLLNTRPDPFDLVRGLRIVHAVAKVLEQLHAHRLTHGNLKPGNIILSLGGGIQIRDAGISALIADQEALSPSAARYMAPEVFHGVAPDAQSDIYSLGMIAYEILAGRGTFEKAFSTVLGDRRDAALRWMKWHTNARAQAPPLHTLNPRVPVRLSELVARMMAKDRTKRIASATQLLDAIHRHFGNQAIEQAEVSPDAFSPSGAQIKATGPGDTAEIPKRDRRPMIAAIAAGVVIVVVLGVWLTISTIRHNQLEQRRATARDVLEEADRDYRAGRFQEALARYETQANGWPDPNDPLRLHGRAGALLAQVQLDLAQGEYASARSGIAELERLPEAGPADRAAVRALEEEVRRRESFTQTIDEVRRHLDRGRFAQARALILDTQQQGLTEAERQLLLDLQVEVEARLKSERVDEALARAEELAEAGDLSAAIHHLNGVKSRLNSPRIERRIEELTVQRRFAEAVQSGESAERIGDLDGAIRAFEEALALNEDPALADRVVKLKARACVERGRELVESGDEVGALAQFTSAVGYDPDNTEARGWLARLNVSMEKRSQVEAGRQAEAAGELEQAVGHYRSALEHGPDAEVEASLRRVEASLALTRAERLIEAGRLDEAGRELQTARELNPDHPAIIEAIERHARHVRYRQLIDRGDAFAEQGRYAQATQAYRKARDIMDTDEVNRRLDDTEYNHLLAQARSYIANEQWASAWGILMTAAKIRITDELTQLREQVRPHLKDTAQERAPDDEQG